MVYFYSYSIICFTMREETLLIKKYDKRINYSLLRILLIGKKQLR